MGCERNLERKFRIGGGISRFLTAWKPPQLYLPCRKISVEKKGAQGFNKNAFDRLLMFYVSSEILYARSSSLSIQVAPFFQAGK